MNVRNLLLLAIFPLVVLTAGCADKVGSPTGPSSTNTEGGMGRLVYNSGATLGFGPVILIDSNGGTIRNMTATVPVINASAVWSSGAGRFVWIAKDTTFPNGIEDVIVTNNDGTVNSIVYQSHNDTIVSFPIISPDGSHVAVLMGGGTAGGRRLLVMTLQSSVDSVIAVNPHFVSTSIAQAEIPCFSPDGSKIAFLDNGGNLIISASDASSVNTVATNVNGDQTDNALWTADWSVTNKLAFFDYFNGESNIRVVNTDGTGMTVVDKGTTPAWSPDGKTLAYSGNGGDILVTSDLGATKTNITNNADYNVAPSWSPDGKNIACTANLGPGGGPTIVSIDVATKAKKTLASAGFFATWLR